MNTLIKKTSGVHFRRIIRKTAANAPWVRDLANRLEGSANAHIRLIKDSEGEEMPLGMSVQLIDDQKVWLVALKAHDGQGEPRDLYIEHEEVSSAMGRYYDRLWEKAEPMLDGGQIVGSLPETI